MKVGLSGSDTQRSCRRDGFSARSCFSMLRFGHLKPLSFGGSEVASPMVGFCTPFHSAFVWVFPGQKDSPTCARTMATAEHHSHVQTPGVHLLQSRVYDAGFGDQGVTAKILMRSASQHLIQREDSRKHMEAQTRYEGFANTNGPEYKTSDSRIPV